MPDRIAIAYGFGRESRIMLNKLKKQNPILIVCIGRKNTEDNLALLNSEIKLLKDHNKVIVLKISDVDSTKGFTEHWDFLEFKGKIRIAEYTNTILEHFSNKKPFDILYVGRRRRDFKDRNMDIDVELPKRVKINGVKFPLWNEDG